MWLRRSFNIIVTYVALPCQESEESLSRKTFSSPLHIKHYCELQPLEGDGLLCRDAGGLLSTIDHEALAVDKLFFKQ